MPLRREGGAAAEEDLAVLGIDIMTSFFVSMVVVFVAYHHNIQRSRMNEAAGRQSEIFRGAPRPAASGFASHIFCCDSHDIIIYFLTTKILFLLSLADGPCMERGEL